MNRTEYRTLALTPQQFSTGTRRLEVLGNRVKFGPGIDAKVCIRSGLLSMPHYRITLEDRGFPKY